MTTTRDHQETLDAKEVQLAIKFVLLRAQSQHEAERGAIAAALAIMVTTRGPAGSVETLRDLADIIEHDVLLPPGGVMQ